MHLRSATLFLLTLAAGCGDDSPPAPDFDAHPVTVTPGRQWAGDSITLSSTAFADWPGDALPLFIGDEAWVTAHRTGDSTFAALLPDTLRGDHYLLRIAAMESPNFEVGLDVAGWTDTRSVAITQTSSFSTAWPADAPTGLLLVQNDTVRFVRAADGGVVAFPATTTTYRTPLGFDAAGRVLAPLNSDTLLAWSIDPSLGTAVAADTFAVGTIPDRNYSRIGSGDWLLTDHNTFLFDPPGSLTDISYITAPRPIVSAAAGRVVIPYRLMTPDPGGIPIFGTDSGTTMSTVAGYSRLDAATFNGAGTILYLAVGNGGASSPSQSLLRVNALTGAVLDSVPSVPNPRDEDLALDETNGWLFEAVRDSVQWTLRVRDAETLDLIAQLRSPHNTDRCPQEAELHLLPAPGQNAVYLGSARCYTPGADVGFARFTLK